MSSNGLTTTVTIVVGINYYPHRKLVSGDLLTFKREPENRFDRNAIAAYNEAGEQVGYLSRNRAKQYAARLDSGLISFLPAIVLGDSTYKNNSYVVELCIEHLK